MKRCAHIILALASLISASCESRAAALLNLEGKVLTPIAIQDRVPWQFTLRRPTADWIRPDFNDAAWETGDGGFGTENTPGALTGTVWSTPDIWLRRRFVIESLDLPSIILLMHHDDDAEVYINGVLAHRATGFTQSYRQFMPSEESRRALRVGTNVIAVHCHQNIFGQYIDVGLMARPQQKLARSEPRPVQSELLPLAGIVLSPTADRRGVIWKYQTDKPSTNWVQPTFDDSQWPESESGFGTHGPGAITRTEWRTPEIWLRRRFVVTNLNLPPLELIMHHDDDARVFINGVLACRAREFTAGYCQFEITEEARKTLVLGTNVLAVHCVQNSTEQYIDAGIVARDPKARRLKREPHVESVPQPAGEWPNLLGPTYDAVYRGKALVTNWPASGPRRVWSKPIGDGWSSPVVGSNRLIMCHRLGDDLIVDCLNPQMGTSHWQFKEENAFSDPGKIANGPRPTPAIRDGRVFVHNNNGTLTCLNLNDGKLLWSRPTRKGTSDIPPDFNSVSSPLVTDKAVILHVGGTNGSVVAFAVATGEVLWKAFDDLPSVSSPVLATLNGKPQVLLATRSALRSFDPADGKLNWQYTPHWQSTSFGAAPMVHGNDVLLSGWHGLAARVVRVSGSDVERLWLRNDSLSANFATPVFFEGNAYGYHGVAGNLSLRAVDLETGVLRKEQRFTAAGSPGTLIRYGDHALVQCENGQLMLVWLSPWGMNFKAFANSLSRSSHAYPAVVDGYVFARDRRQIACFDLRLER